MEFLGIGPLEFLLIVVIAVIVLGPQGIVKGAREAGKFVRKITRSPMWRDVLDTSREIRDIPQKIIREAGIEEDLQEIKRTARGTITEINQAGQRQESKKKDLGATTVKANEDKPA
jgi:sec-independent protein translocase protein TatB